MAIDYLDYRNESKFSHTKDGKKVTRIVYIRAQDEIAVANDSDTPQRGDELNVSSGSIDEILYCDTVQIDTVKEAAGDEAESDLLFKVTAIFAPINRGSGGTTPVPNKATWKISGRPQGINVRNVEDEGDQTHYGPTGSAAEEYTEVTTGVNVNEDGPQGVQIDETVEVLTIDFWKEPDDIEDFLAAVRALKDRVNSGVFEGPWGSYAAGEVRITGYDVEQTSGEIATVSVEFSYAENLTTTGSSGNVPEVYLDTLGTTVETPKKGHQYLWVRTLKSTDESDDADTRPRAIDAHVATFYKEGDFDTLGVTDEIFA